MVHVKIFKTLSYSLKQFLNLSNNEGTYFAIHAIGDIFFALICMYYYDIQYNLSRLVGKPTMWFPNSSDKNQAVQAQKRARSLKFRI